VAEYVEVWTQFAYLCWFGAASPSCVIVACITNMVEIRADGLKLLRDYRRVMPNRSQGCGDSVLGVFRVTLYMAIPINAALIVRGPPL
jgi:hypothetical protein